MEHIISFIAAVLTDLLARVVAIPRPLPLAVEPRGLVPTTCVLIATCALVVHFLGSVVAKTGNEQLEWDAVTVRWWVCCAV